MVLRKRAKYEILKYIHSSTPRDQGVVSAEPFIFVYIHLQDMPALSLGVTYVELTLARDRVGRCKVIPPFQ